MADQPDKAAALALGALKHETRHPYRLAVIGPDSADRRRILRVLACLLGPAEWDGLPPLIVGVDALETPPGVTPPAPETKRSALEWWAPVYGGDFDPSLGIGLDPSKTVTIQPCGPGGPSTVKGEWELPPGYVSWADVNRGFTFKTPTGELFAEAFNSMFAAAEAAWKHYWEKNPADPPGEDLTPQAPDAQEDLSVPEGYAVTPVKGIGGERYRFRRPDGSRSAAVDSRAEAARAAREDAARGGDDGPNLP